MDVRNVKFHFRVLPKEIKTYRHYIKNTKSQSKDCGSFLIIRVFKSVYTCFLTGYINVTGVRSIESLNIPLICFANKLNLTLSNLSDPVIDNITSKCIGIKKKNIQLSTLCNTLQEHKQILGVKYNRERFPCMFLKTKVGTLIWSPFNIVTCVGVKSEDNLRQIQVIAQALDKEWSVVGT